MKKYKNEIFIYKIKNTLIINQFVSVRNFLFANKYFIRN